MKAKANRVTERSIVKCALHNGEVESLIRKGMGRLTDKQRLVIQYRYGIDDVEVLTLKDLATQMDLTRERVRQIHLEALVQLPKLIKRRGVSRDMLF